MKIKAVHKYELRMVDSQTVEMPGDAQVLTAQMQGETLCIWAEIDKGDPFVIPRRFLIRGTGIPYEEPDLYGTDDSPHSHSFNAIREQHYISTVQDRRGFVWHVFEERAHLSGIDARKNRQ